MTLAWILIATSAALLFAVLWGPTASAWSQLRGGPDSERGRLEGAHQGPPFELKLSHRHGPIQPVALFELHVQGPPPRAGLRFEALGVRYRVRRSPGCEAAPSETR